MDLQLSSSMSRLGTESAFEVLARAKQLEAQGREIIYLHIGEPDFDTPSHICEAACAAIRDGHTHYEDPAGMPEFRAAVADHLKATRGLAYEPEQVVIFPGGKPSIFLGILALVDCGDEVICPNPGYPIYESVVNYCGAKPVHIPLREENQFRLDAEELISLVTPKTRLIILNSPHNPTGSVLTWEDYEAIAQVAIRNNIMVLSDETYESIIYDCRQHSIAQVDGMQERTLITDCFSKSFAMTGWRLGFSASCKELAGALTRLIINANSCTNSFVQRAGIAALQGSRHDTRHMVETFQKRRDFIVDGLNALPGVTCLKPNGAFYVFPNITGTGYSSGELYTKLLDEAGVAVLSGRAFGSEGEGYLRISYANSLENIENALDRFARILT